MTLGEVHTSNYCIFFLIYFSTKKKGLCVVYYLPFSLCVWCVWCGGMWGGVGCGVWSTFDNFQIRIIILVKEVVQTIYYRLYIQEMIVGNIKLDLGIDTRSLVREVERHRCRLSVRIDIGVTKTQSSSGFCAGVSVPPIGTQSSSSGFVCIVSVVRPHTEPRYANVLNMPW